jgi:N-6 DNA Methylase
MNLTPQQKFVKAIETRLQEGHKDNRVTSEKLAAQQGITDKKTVKELTELAICNVARRIANQDSSVKSRFDELVSLYDRQTSMAFRDSETFMLQQYSTPVPIAFLMGIWAGIDRTKITYSEKGETKTRKAKYFEPSAGNGLLTIACPEPNLFTVNELSEKRIANLKTQFDTVYNKDASLRSFTSQFKGQFDAVITNPPFAKMETQRFEPIKVSQLASWMMLLALETMRDDGKAAIIIGGHTNYDQHGRITAGETRSTGDRFTFNYLYSHYNVKDIINVSGDLYARQGTKANIRIILIDGRKAQPDQVFAPLKAEANAEVIKDYEALFERMRYFYETPEFIKTIAETMKLSFHKSVQLALKDTLK